MYAVLIGWAITLAVYHSSQTSEGNLRTLSTHALILFPLYGLVVSALALIISLSLEPLS
jgi:hypothetical protein